MVLFREGMHWILAMSFGLAMNTRLKFIIHSVHSSEMCYTCPMGRLKAVGTTVHTAHFEDLQKQAHAYALDYLEQLNAQAASLGIKSIHYLAVWVHQVKM